MHFCNHVNYFIISSVLCVLNHIVLAIIVYDTIDSIYILSMMIPLLYCSKTRFFFKIRLSEIGYFTGCKHGAIVKVRSYLFDLMLRGPDRLHFSPNEIILKIT